jgi:uncharacterized membrane protein
MLRIFPVALDAVMLLITALLSGRMPSLTRRDLLFGVTVAADARSSPTGRSIIRRYRLQVLGITLGSALVLALLAVFAPASWWQSGWLSLLVVAPILLLGVPYLLAYRASRNFQLPRAAGSSRGESPLPPVADLHPRQYGDYVPLLWEALPLAIIAATATYLATTYAAAPTVIPIHFDATGNPNSYAVKTIGSYFLLVWVQLGLEILLTGMSLLIVGSKALPGRAESRFRLSWLRYLYGMKVLTLAFLGALAALIARSASSGSAATIAAIVPLTLVYIVVLLGGAFWLALRTGQGGSRLGSPAETAVDRMDDHYWKLGAFYVNPQDPSFLVERRFGIGWTLNFGNRVSVIALGVLLAVVVIIPVLLTVANLR